MRKFYKLDTCINVSLDNASCICVVDQEVLDWLMREFSPCEDWSTIPFTQKDMPYIIVGSLAHRVSLKPEIYTAMVLTWA